MSLVRLCQPQAFHLCKELIIPKHIKVKFDLKQMLEDMVEAMSLTIPQGLTIRGTLITPTILFSLQIHL